MGDSGSPARPLRLIGAALLLAAVAGGLGVLVLAHRLRAPRVALATSSTSAIGFQDVTAASGIRLTGWSYGASWGDYDGDLRPDLWVGNHASRGSLLANRAASGFREVTVEVLSGGDLEADKHAAAWADFDNDGDQDLIVLVGGGKGVGLGPNMLFVNDGGRLVDRASELGVDYPLARGRTPLWLDHDGDGLLDLLVTGTARPDGRAPPTIFLQSSETFADAAPLGVDTSRWAGFCSLAGLSPAGGSGLVCANGRVRFYRQSAGSVGEGRAWMLERALEKLGLLDEEPCRPCDAAAADLDGDLATDLYVTRGTPSDQELAQVDSRTVHAKIRLARDERGLRFRTRGKLHLELSNPTFSPEFEPIRAENLHWGASGATPPHRVVPLDGGLELLELELDPEADGASGIAVRRDRGVYLGTEADGTWTILAASPHAEAFTFRIRAEQAIEGLAAIGFPLTAPAPFDNVLYHGHSGRLSEAARLAGISGRSVVAGDFDNDTDVDLFVLASGGATNRTNVLLENLGDGRFSSVPDAAGAAGTTLGLGDSVTVVDYDLDGFLDLFVTNGSGAPTVPALTHDAPHQLFRNVGNSNHWLEIDLQGTRSNRDGVGAVVHASAGGRTWMRERTGGMHRYSQNHARIHFGLGSSRLVERIEVRWPSGLRQRIADVPGDHLIRIVEPSDPEADGGFEILR